MVRLDKASAARSVQSQYLYNGSAINIARLPVSSSNSLVGWSPLLCPQNSTWLSPLDGINNQRYGFMRDTSSPETLLSAPSTECCRWYMYTLNDTVPQCCLLPYSKDLIHCGKFYCITHKMCIVMCCIYILLRINETIFAWYMCFC